MAKDYYQTLGVDRSATNSEIKSAYRKLSKEWHPDKHKGEKGAEQKFQEINEAYEVLSDDKKKQAYDQFGTADGAQGFGGQGFGGFDFSGFQNAQGDFGGFSDIFESFFGGAQGGSGGRRRQSRGGDIEVALDIEFADVVTGVDKTIRIDKFVSCEQCNGSGLDKGSKMVDCSTCGGSGQIQKTAQSFFGTIAQTVICSDCGGSGQKPEKACSDCNGNGRRQEKAEIAVSVPAGIHDGQTLRLQGEGNAGERGSGAGDLYVHIRVRSDSRFQRDGDDIRTTISIPVVDAILGTDISIETVHGPVSLTVPAGTQPQQTLRMKNKGLPILSTSRFGDHYVLVNIDIPQKLSKKEKELMEEWRRL